MTERLWAHINRRGALAMGVAWFWHMRLGRGNPREQREAEVAVAASVEAALAIFPWTTPTQDPRAAWEQIEGAWHVEEVPAHTRVDTRVFVPVALEDVTLLSGVWPPPPTVRRAS
jgi:hypothetical protein